MPTGYLGSVLAGLETDPDRVALVHGERRVTAGELLRSVHHMAHALAGCGLRLGDGVACLAVNSPEAVACRLAVQLAGCRYTGLCAAFGAKEQAAVIADMGASAVVVDAELAASGALRPDGVPLLLTLGLSELGTDLLDLAADTPTTPFPCPAGEDDLSQVVYTSGSTGPAKGIPHTFAHEAVFLRDGRHLLGSGPKRFLLSMPLAHLSGEITTWMLADAGTVVIHDGFSAPAVLRTVAEQRITHLFVTPVQIDQLLAHPAVSSTDLSSVQQILYGGMASHPRRITEALRQLGPRLLHVYGLWEAGFVAALPADEHLPRLLSSVGRPLPGIHVEIRDPSGRRRPTGTVGEVWISSPAAATGYWRRPEQTAASIRAGWVHTGDRGRLDESGYLHLVGRSKDVINVAGYEVHPAQVEQELVRHPSVAAAAVVAVPDAATGEAVHAVVVATTGAKPDTAELRALVRGNLSRHHAPVSFDFVERLPLTPSGKPDRQALLSLHQTDTLPAMLPATSRSPDDESGRAASRPPHPADP